MLIPWVFFLKEDQQLLVESFTRRWVVRGPRVYVASPFERVKLRKGMTLGPIDYLHVRNFLTGEVRCVRGPQMFFPTESEEILGRFTASPLKANQYLKILDERTGVIRVERGEGSVYLEPTEKALGAISDGVNVDENTAVLVRDLETGQLDLITAPQVFMPAATQEIVEVRHRIRLEDHETLVIKDQSGKYIFRRGRDTERSFFLAPYSDLVEFFWSTGIHKEKRTLRISRLDERPKFMWYEFEARTQDNVELVLGITFFWQIVDVERMIRSTDDTPGDICSHARSAIIQSVSQVSLEQFLSEFNRVVRGAVLESDTVFYTERGVKLHAVEVRSIACKDAATQMILQEIIRETTDRLNQLQKQASENEVKVRQIEGEIEAEKMRQQLLAARRENVQAAAQMEGEGEGVRVRAFFEGLGSEFGSVEKLGIFNLLRKQEALEKLSQGTAQLYFTPEDVDLSIETRRVVNSSN